MTTRTLTDYFSMIQRPLKGQPGLRGHVVASIAIVRGVRVVTRFARRYASIDMTTNTGSQDFSMIQRLDVLVPGCRRDPVTGFTQVGGVGVITRFTRCNPTTHMATHTTANDLAVIQWCDELLEARRWYPMTRLAQVGGIGVVTRFTECDPATHMATHTTTDDLAVIQRCDELLEARRWHPMT
jgi:hypothetical protein